MEFFEAAAQLFPLIYVASVFEAKAIWQLPAWEQLGFGHSTIIYRIGLTGLATVSLVFGESAALWALAHKDKAPVNFEAGYPAWLVAACLLMGMFTTFAYATLHICLEHAPQRDSLAEKRWLRMAIVLFTLILSAGTTWFAWSVGQALSN